MEEEASVILPSVTSACTHDFKTCWSSFSEGKPHRVGQGRENHTSSLTCS